MSVVFGSPTCNDLSRDTNHRTKINIIIVGEGSYSKMIQLLSVSQ